MLTKGYAIHSGGSTLKAMSITQVKNVPQTSLDELIVVEGLAAKSAVNHNNCSQNKVKPKFLKLKIKKVIENHFQTGGS